MSKSKVIESRHPDYITKVGDWMKWRLAFDADVNFRDKYLYRLSEREDVFEFGERKKQTYVPAFAAGNLVEVKNAITKRFGDIIRKCSVESFMTAAQGLGLGVDRNGSSMNYFIGDAILQELIIQAKVGIFVDMPRLKGATMLDQQDSQPYVYIFKAEEILNWSYIQKEDGVRTLRSVLLLRRREKIDAETGLVSGKNNTYEHYQIVLVNDETKVKVVEYNANGDVVGTVRFLNIDFIPLIIETLPKSLMSVIADYQIALMQLTSSDLMYLIKANFPFYTEQANQAFQSPHVNTATSFDDGQNQSSRADAPPPAGRMNDIKVGATRGRRYPMGADRPEFINPSPEPMEISIKKQEQIKDEMRQLIHLTLSSFMPKMQSQESKKLDNLPLESGLSFIGLVLNRAERNIYKMWCAYEGITDEDASIVYPKNFSMLTQEQIDAEINTIRKDIDTVPSITAKRELTKRIIWLRFSQHVDEALLNKMYDEIDKATVISGDPNVLVEDVAACILSIKDAAIGRCYPAGTSEKALADKLKLQENKMDNLEDREKRGDGDKIGRLEPPPKDEQ